MRKRIGYAVPLAILAVTPALAEPFFYGRISKIEQGLHWMETPSVAPNRDGYFIRPPEGVVTIKGRKRSYKMRFDTLKIQLKDAVGWLPNICNKLYEAVTSVATTKKTKRWTTLSVSCG